MDKSKESMLKPKGMTKKEQLKIVINKTLRKFKVAILMYDEGLSGASKQDNIIDGYTNTLMKEVSIRTELK